MDRRTTKTTHYSLVALICVLIVTFALGMGGVATAGQDVAKTDAVSGFSKVGNFDMETLRQQYFSQTAVQETTASYSGKRWVIVELEGDSLFTSYENRGYWYGDFTTYCNSEEGKLLKADIEASHKDFLAVLDNNRIDYKYKYSYSTLNNGVALKVDADTFNEIKKLDGVKSVYYSESYAIPTVAVSNNANVYTTGIYDSSNLSYKGEGMVVAVLDTGLDYSHEAFSTMPSNPAWTKEYVAAKMAASTRFNAQATVDEVYYNSKVPFAYDYADDDADVYPSYSTHGTHVAGIVAGKSDYVVNKETDETFVGVAPEAQLVICKVFTDNLDSDSLGGADTIDIIAAVSDCVELGVDVINMSLGSSAGFSDEKSDELINEVYNRVRAAGISLVVAASNDYSSGFGGGNGTNLASNPDSGTVGSPSTYGAALSVASINGQKATFIQANNDENQVAFITESSDANGNYVVTGSGETSYNGIYGKDVDGITYHGDSQYIYGLVGETSTTYVYVDANKDSHYATISGELAANSIITVSYGEGKSVVFTITKVAKATADGSFKQASSERGTYNGDKGAIFLDGFGKATVDGAAYSYYINGANVVVLSNETATIGVTIDTEIGVYLEKTTDGKAQIFTQSGSTYYTFELDGFGGVNYIYKSSYSTSITRGTYEFSQDGATVTIAKVNSDVNGTYNIQDSGKVLVESTSERKVFIADGYTVTTHEQDFVGYYVDANGNAIEITIEDGRIWLAIAGTNKRLTKNWNGTELTYTATDTDAGKGFNTSSATYTLTLVDGNVVISHDCIQSYDSISENYVIEKKSVTYTKTEKPFAFPESARGTWYLDDNTVVVIAEKSITVGGIEGADYNVTEAMFGTNYEFSIGGKKYMVYEDAETAGKWYYGPADSYEAIELSKNEHAATLDAFAGSWTRTEDNAKKFVFTFNGEGTLTLTSENSYFNGKTAKYTIVDNKITLSSFVGYDWTFTLTDANTIAVTAIDSDGYTCSDFANGNITKQVSGGAAVTADMQGTFTGTNGYTTNYTLIVGENSIVYKEVDSTFDVNINNTITDYTITDDGWTITWTMSGVTYKFTNPTGYAYKLYVGTDDYTLTKQA